jgi:hypothetical protein
VTLNDNPTVGLTLLAHEPTFKSEAGASNDNDFLTQIVPKIAESFADGHHRWGGFWALLTQNNGGERDHWDERH